jgi:hypothetical protein
MSFATNSFSDYRYRRHLITDKFLRECYDNACAMKKPSESEFGRIFRMHDIKVKEDADHYNDVGIIDKCIYALHIETVDLLQHIKKIPDHVTCIDINQNITDYDKLMAALGHILVNPYEYYMDIRAPPTIRIGMNRGMHSKLIIEFEILMPVPRDVIDKLTDVTCMKSYDGPIIDLSECKSIRYISGDTAIVQGVKFEELTVISIVSGQFDVALLKRLNNIENVIIRAGTNIGNVIDISEMPVENLQTLSLSDITITGFSGAPNLHTLHMRNSSVSSIIHHVPSLRILSVSDTTSLVIGEGPHEGPISINASSLEELVIDNDIYDYVRETQNVKSLGLYNEKDIAITIKDYTALRELYVYGCQTIEFTLQPSLRILLMRRDDAVAAIVFGTDAIEYINDSYYVHALSQ